MIVDLEYTPRQRRTFAARLTKLADHLETTVAKMLAQKKVKFDMSQWSNGEITKEHPCGTAACAAGYGTAIFRDLVLQVERPYWDPANKYTTLLHKPTGAIDFDACREFFGIKEPFDPELYPDRVKLPVVVSRLRKAAKEMLDA